MSKINVTDIKIVDLTPRVKKPEHVKLIPKNYSAKYFEVVIHGVNAATSNAIRRTISCEMLVKALNLDYYEIDTDNVFLIPEMIVSRFKMLPINQNVGLNSTFSIDVQNDTLDVVDVKSSELKVNTGNLTDITTVLSNTFTLFTLPPKTYFRARNITVQQNYGFRESYGALVLACNVASVAMDQKPINSYEKSGIFGLILGEETGKEDDQDKGKSVEGESSGLSSSVANPKVWKISFNTNGTMPPKKIMSAACDNLIERVNSVKDLLYSIKNNKDEYILTIEGESDTIGNLIARTISDLYPGIIFVTYFARNIDRTLVIKVRCDEDITIIFNSAIDHIIETLTKIKGFF